MLNLFHMRFMRILMVLYHKYFIVQTLCSIVLKGFVLNFEKLAKVWSLSLTAYPCSLTVTLTYFCIVINVYIIPGCAFSWANTTEDRLSTLFMPINQL